MHVMKYLQILGEKASPLKNTNGFKCLNDLTAVKNLAAPPIGSLVVEASTLYTSLKWIMVIWLIISGI